MGFFGGTKTKTYNLLDAGQQEYQNFLRGQSQSLGDMTMDSSYMGDYANRSYLDMQNALAGQMNDALVSGRHSGRFHSSGQRYRDAAVRNQFSNTMTNLAYQHNTQQQDWMQQYAQKAKDWNYMGKYQAMTMMSDPILQQKTAQYQVNKPGFLDYFNATLGMTGTVADVGKKVKTF